MSRAIIARQRPAGRRLETPKGDRTRPTSDRVREALFSAIESCAGTLHGLRFLDLYAGSGAIGLEAWSRGAEAVTLVESDRRTADLIARNARRHRLPAPTSAPPRSPPCWRGAGGAVRPGLQRPALPAARRPTSPTTWRSSSTTAGSPTDALVVVERGSRSPEPTWPRGLEPLPGKRRTKKYGETTLWYAAARRTAARRATTVTACVVPSAPARSTR